MTNSTRYSDDSQGTGDNAIFKHRAPARTKTKCYFGMKPRISVDAKSGLTHSLVTTPANEHDFNQVGKLLHGAEHFISGDAGHQRV